VAQAAVPQAGDDGDAHGVVVAVAIHRELGPGRGLGQVGRGAQAVLLPAPGNATTVHRPQAGSVCN
jgi:hypothetical protein